MIDYSRLKEMIQHSSPKEPPKGYSHPSACVFLLIYNQPDPHILAIQKSDTEGYPWRNQAALPGGNPESRDASPIAAAYRELQEELNISRNQVDFIGSIGHFQTLTKPKDIEAFIGLWNGIGPLRYDATEISRILELPLKNLMRTHKTRRYHGRVPDTRELEYPFEDVIIWGATAQIIHHFIELVYPLLENSD